jgi:hypothetical protein
MCSNLSSRESKTWSVRKIEQLVAGAVQDIDGANAAKFEQDEDDAYADTIPPFSGDVPDLKFANPYGPSTV